MSYSILNYFIDLLLGFFSGGKLAVWGRVCVVQVKYIQLPMLYNTPQHWVLKHLRVPPHVSTVQDVAKVA